MFYEALALAKGTTATHEGAGAGGTWTTIKQSAIAADAEHEPCTVQPAKSYKQLPVVHYTS